MAEPIIKLKEVSQIFNQGRHNEVRALNSINLQVEAGQAALVRGPSGSGKSTLLNLLSALSTPTSGMVRVLGEDVGRWPEKFRTAFRRRHIGIVFQNFYLIESLTVFQNIATPLVPLGLSGKELSQRVQAAAAQVSIEHRLHFKAATLSGGEQQRTAIARALVSSPEILITDEPTAHLDSKLSADILNIFSRLKVAGKTLVIATHDPLLNAHPLIDKTFCLRDGQLEGANAC